MEDDTEHLIRALRATEKIHSDLEKAIMKLQLRIHQDQQLIMDLEDMKTELSRVRRVY